MTRSRLELGSRRQCLNQFPPKATVRNLQRGRGGGGAELLLWIGIKAIYWIRSLSSHHVFPLQLKSSLLTHLPPSPQPEAEAPVPDQSFSSLPGKSHKSCQSYIVSAIGCDILKPITVLLFFFLLQGSESFGPSAWRGQRRGGVSYLVEEVGGWALFSFPPPLHHLNDLGHHAHRGGEGH